MLTVEQVKAALAAVRAEDGAAAIELLEAMIASAATGEDEAPVEEELSTDTGEEVEELSTDTEEEETVEENSKLAQMLKRATGEKSVGEAVAKLGRVAKEHAELQKQSEALHLSSKRELVADLIKLGVETPATAWKGPADKRQPVDRLMNENLDSMRTRIALLSKVRGTAPRAPTRSQDSDEGESVAQKVARLSRKKLAEIKKLGITPEDFIKRREGAVRRVVG